jgi:hypothetical protein
MSAASSFSYKKFSTEVIDFAYERTVGKLLEFLKHFLGGVDSYLFGLILSCHP